MFKRFINWMKFNPPEMETAEGWYLFGKRYREEAPIRHWIMEGPLSTFKIKLINKIRKPFKWIRYRFVIRHYRIDTDLEKGSYHDAMERLFYANFKILEDFVEIDTAYSYDYEAMHNTLGWKKYLPRFIRPVGRNPDVGIRGLLFDISLGDQSPYQSKDGNELYELYTWWKDVRPLREWPEWPHLPNLPKDEIFGSSSSEWKENFPEEKEKLDAYHQECSILSEEWRKEDQRMLTRLTNVYESMWR